MIPKQFSHWMRMIGFERIVRSDKLHFISKGRRMIRVIPNNKGIQIDISQKLENFDRWANSVVHRVFIEDLSKLNKSPFVEQMKEELKIARGQNELQ